jgi:hypothetical protein
MGPNRPAQDRERAAAEAAAKAKRAEAARKAVAEAQKIVADMECAPSRRARAVVLPDYRRCYRGRASVAFILLPCLRTIRLRGHAYSRPAPQARRFRASSHQCRVAGVRPTRHSPGWKC